MCVPPGPRDATSTGQQRVQDALLDDGAVPRRS